MFVSSLLTRRAPDPSWSSTLPRRIVSVRQAEVHTRGNRLSWSKVCIFSMHTDLNEVPSAFGSGHGFPRHVIVHLVNRSSHVPIMDRGRLVASR